MIIIALLLLLFLILISGIVSSAAIVALLIAMTIILALIAARSGRNRWDRYQDALRHRDLIEANNRLTAAILTHDGASPIDVERALQPVPELPMSPEGVTGRWLAVGLIIVLAIIGFSSQNEHSALKPATTTTTMNKQSAPTPATTTTTMNKQSAPTPTMTTTMNCFSPKECADHPNYTPVGVPDWQIDAEKAEREAKEAEAIR
jgi:hypothetical protein